MDEHDERRGAKRFALDLALRLEGGTGRTRDVSARGVFFTTPRILQPGDTVRCVLELAGGEQLLEFEAQVVRVMAAEDGFGVAARFDALQTELGGLAGRPATDELLH
jgi:hypothetical protein